MGDITDLYSIRSNAISTTPSKSYVSSFTTTDTSEDATGISLSVPNNHFYYISFQLLRSAGTVTASLKSNGSAVQTWSVVNNTDISSAVFQNVSGSAVTITLTVQSPAGTGDGGVAIASLIEGLFIGSPPAGVPNANLSSVVYQFSGQTTGVVNTGNCNGTIQKSSTTTAVTTTLTTNPIVSGSGNSIFSGSGVFAYDFTGTYVSI